MKTYKILLFILICTSAVASLAFIFPKNGVNIGTTTLKYADANDFLYPAPIETIDPHTQTQALADANKIRMFIASREENEYRARQLKFVAHPHSINFPNDNIKWFDNIFDALTTRSNKPTRILHYGDSQIEEDRMTSTIRHGFQELFGGYGVGLLPPRQTINSAAISQKSYGNHSRFVVFGLSHMQSKDGEYGPTGQMLQTSESYTTHFSATNLYATEECTKKFQNLSVMYGKNTTPLAISIKSGDHTDTIHISDTTQSMRFANFRLPFVAKKASLSVNGKCQIYGYIVDGNRTGVQVDNIPMRGCSGTVFTRISSNTLRPFYNKYNIPLIILQYGGNTVPYLKGKKAIENYCNSLLYQIEYIKRMSPKSKILFIGPSDMSTSIDGKMQTYPHLPQIVDKLRETCNNNDVAYWDLYAAMGGYNAMVTWVNSSPALAGSDHIHFTWRGSKTAAEMFCDYIEELYNYYIERKNTAPEENNTIATDTTNTQSSK